MAKNKMKNLARFTPTPKNDIKSALWHEKIFMQKNAKKYKNRILVRGFTFMEVMIAVFIFALVFSMVAMIFSKMIKNYTRTKDIQRDMESAQQAMNLMAKTIRTSVIDSTDKSGNATSINLYDYSQNKCIKYSLNGNNLEYREYGPNPDGTFPNPPDPAAFQDVVTSCTPNFPAAASVMANGISDLRFYKDATTTTPPVAGRVAISMQVCPAGSCAGNDQVRIQTTVTLRERGYEETGL